MEGVMCQLCGRENVTSSTALEPGSSLWMEMYHKTVRETLLPSMEEGGGDGVPKLTFTFSFPGPMFPTRDDGQSRDDDDDVRLCETCLGEVTQLKIIHQQMEDCKRRMTAQVERIENVFQSSTTTGAIKGEMVRNRRKTAPFWKRRSLTTGGLGAEMALTGTSVGKGNISRVLRCLGSLCEDVESSQGNNLPCETSNRPTVPFVPEETITTPSANVEHFVEEKASIPPILSGDLECHSSSSRTYWADPGSQQPMNTHCEQDEEEFTHIVKLDPDVMLFATDDVGASFPDESAPDPNFQFVQSDPLAEEGPHWETISKPAKPRHANPGNSRIRLPSRKKKSRAGPRKEGHTKQPSVSEGNGGPVVGHARKVRLGSHPHHKPYPNPVSHNHYRLECEFCGKKFNLKTRLSVHRRSHTGEKPFSCSHCGIAFSTNGNLTRHIKAQHGKGIEIIADFSPNK